MFKANTAIVITVFAAFLAGDLHAASADIIDLDEHLKARLAREKLRRKVDRKDGDDDAALNGGGCNVNIGNAVNTKRKAGGKTEVNVVITGPVIQTGNKCR